MKANNRALSQSSILREVNSPKSREYLVDYSRSSMKQGRRKYHVLQATREIDSHIFLMSNRIKRLKVEEAQTERALEQTMNKEKQLEKVRETHRSYQAQLEARKPDVSKEISKKKQRIQELKENHKRKMSEAQQKLQTRKQQLRATVRRESLDNKKLIDTIRKVHTSRKKKRVTEIRERELKMKQKRIECAKDYCSLLSSHFESKCNQELRTALVAKQKLMDLTEEKLKDTLRLELSSVLKDNNS